LLRGRARQRAGEKSPDPTYPDPARQGPGRTAPARSDASTPPLQSSAGITSGTYIFAIPGSMGGCKDAWSHVLGPEFGATHKPCKPVELIFRLRER